MPLFSLKQTSIILSFNEIKDGQQFENLVVAYFKNLNIEKLAITEIRVEPSGVGADGVGDQFLSLLSSSLEGNEPLIRRFFPKYYDYLIKNNKL